MVREMGLVNYDVLYILQSAVTDDNSEFIDTNGDSKWHLIISKKNPTTTLAIDSNGAVKLKKRPTNGVPLSNDAKFAIFQVKDLL